MTLSITTGGIDGSADMLVPGGSWSVIDRMRLLVVEDSQRLRESLVTGLRDAGYAVDAVEDGVRGLAHLCTSDYDAVILDIRLPGLDGMSVLRQARERGIASRVLMLTAMDSVDDRVRGLRSGADDYLVKPFSFEELLARIEALVRRRYEHAASAIRIGSLEIDTAAKTASAGGVRLELATREYLVLEYMAARRGKVVSRLELEEHVYDDRTRVLSNSIDAAIYQLRKVLGAAGLEGLIKTRRGLGYVLQEPRDAVHP